MLYFYLHLHSSLSGYWYSKGGHENASLNLFKRLVSVSQFSGLDKSGNFL